VAASDFRQNLCSAERAHTPINHHETYHNDSSEEEDATENEWFRSDKVSIIKIFAFPWKCSIEETTRIERRIFRRNCRDGDSNIIINGTTFGYDTTFVINLYSTHKDDDGCD
jgi:hypothetical protein